MKHSVKAALAEVVNAPADRLVNIVITPSMESSIGMITDLAGFSFQSLSLETQQIDHHTAQVVGEVVKSLVTPRAAPTVPTVYAIGAKSLLEGDGDSQVALRTAVMNKISNTDENIVVAVLDEDEGTNEAAVATDDGMMVEAAKQFVSTVDIPVVTSVEALQDFLKSIQ